MQKNLIEYLESTARAFPHKEAIVDSTHSITFAELRSKALQIALAIHKKNPHYFKSPVFVYLPKSYKSIVAFMATLYSGNFYTPSDVDFPFAKVSLVLTQLKPSIFITNSVYKQKLIDNGIDSALVLDIDSICQGEECKGNNRNILPLPQEIENVLGRCVDSDVAYTLFTSGSTGTPKGVAVAHKSIINYIEWFRDEFEIAENERIGNQAPFYFDNSTLDIYLSLSTGATLYIIKKSLFAFPAKLIEYLNAHKINMIFWVPSALGAIANADILSHMTCENLRKIIFAGEAMPNKILNYWRKYIPQAIYANLYGPTEATVDCTFYIVDRVFEDSDALPIGKPCRNYDVFVLSESNEMINTQGEIGELCVRGVGVALGYYGDFERSKEVFVQNPLNNVYEEKIYRTGDLVCYNEFGELMYCGRKDSQIKHLGYRIELGEIESAAFGLNAVQNACALYDDRDKKIVLFVSIDKSCEVVESCTLHSLITRDLAKTLAQYMLPNVVISLETFPLNDNGKINRKELKMMYENTYKLNDEARIQSAICGRRGGG
ncbi:amino acid adenylation domain-containing protein [Helicobacter labetoulli]|uniref:amino acid adenylation domain-containing protein n=1 Tax=Helicobacter labetoulli TaxID=2315333 RepID=UPI000EF65D2A|nr:amino acid adenylation domain-containing protein [Helicobacter labetoulli]